MPNLGELFNRAALKRGADRALEVQQEVAPAVVFAASIPSPVVDGTFNALALERVSPEVAPFGLTESGDPTFKVAGIFRVKITYLWGRPGVSAPDTSDWGDVLDLTWPDSLTGSPAVAFECRAADPHTRAWTHVQEFIAPIGTPIDSVAGDPLVLQYGFGAGVSTPPTTFFARVLTERLGAAP